MSNEALAPHALRCSCRVPLRLPEDVVRRHFAERMFLRYPTISQVSPKAKIVFVTQNTDTDVIRAALETGVQGYVMKADAGKDLVRAIKAVLGGDKFISSALNL
jgi:CheY-like chemotaxis protein